MKLRLALRYKRHVIASVTRRDQRSDGGGRTRERLSDAVRLMKTCLKGASVALPSSVGSAFLSSPSREPGSVMFSRRGRGPPVWPQSFQLHGYSLAFSLVLPDLQCGSERPRHLMFELHSNSS